MELVYWFVDLVLHLDRHLVELLQEYGLWIHAILFLIVFAETGFVVTPFLPGDSLLFVAGTLWAATGMQAICPGPATSAGVEPTLGQPRSARPACLSCATTR